MNIKKHIPNAITCLNLLCGGIAIVYVFNGDLVLATYFVWAAAILDFFDGMVARLLNVHSEIGKQLDSLADMVSFGVVPGAMMFKFINQQMITCGGEDKYNDFATISFIGFLITIFSAIRLAKFNIDTRQSESFIGLPTPANALFISSFPLILNSDFILFKELINNSYFLISITIISSYILVAELPLFALKFKSFSFKGNEIRYLFLAISLLLLIIFQVIAIPFIILLYIILSVINNIISKKKQNEI